MPSSLPPDPMAGTRPQHLVRMGSLELNHQRYAAEVAAGLHENRKVKKTAH